MRVYGSFLKLFNNKLFLSVYISVQVAMSIHSTVSIGFVRRLERSSTLSDWRRFAFLRHVRSPIGSQLR